MFSVLVYLLSSFFTCSFCSVHVKLYMLPACLPLVFSNLFFSFEFARIASENTKDTDPSVLVNAHFDGPLGSPGAGDCASCVGMLKD